MPTGNWKNYTDSDGLKALKTDHLLTDKKAKKSISLDSRFVDLENAGRSNTLMAPRNSNKNLVLHIYTEKTTLGNIWLLQLCNSLANSINLLLVQHLWETSKVYSNNSSHCMNSFPALHSWNLHRKWHNCSNFREFVKNTIFAEKTLADCSLFPRQRTPRPQILPRKLSRE